MARLVGRRPVETKVNALNSGSIPIYNSDLKSWDTIHLSEVTGSVFPFTGSAIISGSLTVSGSTNIVGTTGNTLLSTNADTLIFTGSLYTSGSIISTGSLEVNGGITGSLLGTASFASNAGNSISSSYAATASSADDFNVRGTLTAQRIVVQTITSSTEYVTGSTIFGSLLNNTHQFTGSVSITGSLEVNGRNYINDSSSFESRITTNSSSFANFSGSYINESSSFASRVTTDSASFATFSGSYINESSSFASRITTDSASFANFSGSYINESSSFASRITTNSASFVSFSGSYVNESSSFASRITINSASFVSFSGSYVNESSSFASRITTNSASFVLFSGSYVIESSSFANRIAVDSASFTVFSGSYVIESGSFSNQITANSASLAAFSGSYVNESSSFASRITTNSASFATFSGSYVNESSSFASRITTNSASFATFSGSYVNESSSFASRITTDSASFATFSGSYINESSSFASRITTDSASFATFSGSYTNESSSFASRITTNSASFANFSGSYVNESSSFASRITTNSASFAEFSGSYINESGSFASRVTTNSASFATFSGSYINESSSFASRITTDSASFATFSGSYVNESSSFSSRITTNSASFATFSGSYINESSSFASRITTDSASFATFSGSYINESSSFASRITTNSASISNLSSSFREFSGSYNTGSFTGSFKGDGGGLYNIPAGGIVGLNLSQIASGSATASISPDRGFIVNTFTEITGSTKISGSLNVTGGITGSLLGTASYALNALSSSYATTASSADDFVVRGTLTAQTIIAQIITSSTEYITGSTQFGSLLSNIHQFTGSVNITGSLNINGENLTGISSSFSSRITTNSASFAEFSGSYINESSSFESRITTNSASFATFSGSYVNESSSFASRITTNSASISSLSASFKEFSGSFMTGSFTGSFIGTLTGTASYASQSLSASYAENANLLDGKDSSVFASTGSNSFSGSQIISSGYKLYTDGVENLTGNTLNLFGDVKFNGNVVDVPNDLAVTGSFVANNMTGSLLGTASYALNAISSSYALQATTSSYSLFALSSSYASSSLSASYALNALSSSYALTASYAKDIVISGSVNNVNYIDFNTGSAVPAWKSGRVFWDNTDGCLNVYNAEADITLQVGQENWTRVRNNTGTTITNGTIVRIIGSQGDAPTVERAQSIAKSGSINVDTQILGVATHTIEDASFGYVTTQGLVRGLNTSGFSDGDSLFVGTGSAGVLQNTAPTAPFEIIPVGVCVKASPGGSGIIYVAVQQPIDFSDLSSAKVGGLYGYGDLWTYVQSGSYGVWTHTNQLSGSYGITGSLGITGGVTGSLLGTASYAINANLLDGNDSTTFATTSSNLFKGDQTISGSLFVSGSSVILQNLTVLGTASYNSVTASSLLVNDNWITVTTTSSLGRFGGIRVLDYESTGDTASFAWDTTTDRWLEIAPVHDTYSSSLFIMGPKNTGSLGSEIGLTPNFIPRSEDEHHLINSAISDNGSIISLGRNSLITGSLNVSQGITGSLFGTSSYARQALTSSYSFYAESVGGIISGSIVTTGSNNFIGNQTISGSLSVTGNLSVLGTASFTYVTASQIALSSSFLSLNVFEPAERFGGIKVYDSGSLGHQATASLAWDSTKNVWIYQNVTGSANTGGVFIAGPENTGSLGDEQFLIEGRIPKSVGENHIDNSIMSDISGSIGVSGSLFITGSLGLKQSIYVNQNTSSLASGTQIISTNATSSYTSAFYNYVLSSGANARAGQFIAVWNGSTINYTDVSTTDIGVTTNVALTASLNSGNILLTTVLPSSNWTIKTTVNFL